MSRKRVSPDEAETLYVAAIHSVEEVRDQLCRMGLGEEFGDLEDAQALRQELLAEVERIRGQPSG